MRPSTGAVAAEIAAGDQDTPYTLPPDDAPADSPYRYDRRTYLELLAECMAAEGFEIRIDRGYSGFGMSGDSSAEANAQQGALELCGRWIDPVRLQPQPPWTPEQLRQLYALQLQWASCIRSLGYVVPAMKSVVEYLALDGQWSVVGEMSMSGIDVSEGDYANCDRSVDHPDFLDW